MCPYVSWGLGQKSCIEHCLIPHSSLSVSVSGLHKLINLTVLYFCDCNVFVLIQPCFSQPQEAGKRNNVLANFLLRLQARLSFQTHKASAVVNTTEIWVFASLDSFWRGEAGSVQNFHHGESVYPSGLQLLASSRKPLLSGRAILVAAWLKSLLQHLEGRIAWFPSLLWLL